MKNSKKGFTLIEMLTVVLIIGIITVFSMQYFRAGEKSRSAEALSVLGKIVDAQKRHYLTHEAYAVKFSDLDLEFNDKNGIEVGEQNSLETPSFVYTLNGTEGDKAGVIATRHGGKYQYKFGRSYTTNAIACDNEAICPTLLPNYKKNISDVVTEGTENNTGNDECPTGTVKLCSQVPLTGGSNSYQTNCSCVALISH